MAIQVHTQLEAPLREELTDFLARSPGSAGVCAEHDPAWLDVLCQALGHEPHLLIARDSGSSSNGTSSGPIIGYLPTVLVRSPLFGRYLVSLPYVNRAGVVAEDPQVGHDLIGRAFEVGGELKVKYIELRNHTAVIEHAHVTGTRDEKYRMVLDIPQTPDDLFKAVGPKVRNLIRKGEKHELSIRWSSDPDERSVLDAFYDVFSVNMRDLGTPVYGKSLFRWILRSFEGRAELAVVDYRGQPIAGAVLVHDPGGPGREASTQVPSASALREHNETNANMWMYHQLLLRAMARGSKAFDFGRSSEGSGTYRFKKQWGAQPHPTVWQYHLREGDMNAMRPDSPKNQRRVETWKRLPVWLTRLVGPSIVRGIP